MIEAPLIYGDARRPQPSIELLRSPANPAVQVASALDRVRRAPTTLEAMRMLGDITPLVDALVTDAFDPRAILEPILEAIDDSTDTLTGLAAVHALARVPGPRAALTLADLVSAGDAGYEEHALWALGGRPATNTLAWPVARAVGRGGLAGMHAQQALASWAFSDPHLALAALQSALAEVESASARRYIVETIGLVPSMLASQALERVALTSAEDQRVRYAAVMAFSERPADKLPTSFSRLGGALGAAVREVRAHRRLVQRGPRRTHTERLRVAQVHLGETGGLATLLPQLGDALAGQQRVAEPLTVVRAGRGARPDAAGHRLETIALEPGEGTSFVGSWPSTVAAERGIRGAFLAQRLPEVVHLRMADPGTYAAARVAMSMAVPLVFTLAPDPHGPIEAAERAGILDRRSFAAEDGRNAYWFRASLVERVAREAREIVLFPRSGGIERIESITGIDLSDGPPRHTVIAEGIDIGRTDLAAQAVGSDETPAVLEDLQTAIERLPSTRHGLPIVVSAGRLIELKGMARLVEAFARNEALSALANLVIVGGDLARPSAAEATELARTEHLFERYPGLEHRVVLLGQREHAEVALLLAAARLGWRSLIGAGGSYACASAKEEFGLAIVEALAAGLPVTAPRDGGPSTYVEPGITGSLVDTTDIAALAGGIEAALELAADRQTAERTRVVVEDGYTLARMARSLTAVYRVTVGASALSLPPSEEALAA